MLKAIITIFISGLFYYFSSGFHFAWILMWFAPVPVLVYVYRARFFSSLAVSLLVGLVPGINEMMGYATTLLPMKMLLMGTLSQAAIWTFILLLTRVLMRRIASAMMIFAYPTLLSLADWLQSLGPHGTYSSIAYNQIDFLPILQIASLTSFFGITFVASLFASVLAYLILFFKNKKQPLSALMIAIMIILAAMVYGEYRVVAISKQMAPQIKVGLMVVNPKQNGIYDETPPQLILNAYASHITRLAQQGAQVILLPEKAFSVTSANRASILEQVSALARLNHVFLITGVYENLGSQKYNVAWVFDPSGARLGEYHKEHLVPVAEAGVTPGTELLSFPINQILAGVAICRDLDFINPAHEYGLEHINILFVPAHDLSVDAKLHTVGAIMRAVENGYSLVRTSKFGELTVTNSVGKILGKAEAITPGDNAEILISVQAGRTQTLYDHYGNWFAWVLLLFLVVLIFLSMRRKK